MKKITAWICILAMILGTASIASASGIKVVVDGRTLNAECMMVNNRVLAPLRAISESMGASVDWEEATQKITVKKAYYQNLSGTIRQGTTIAYLWIGNKTGKVNGAPMQMDVPAQLVNGNTMVPVAALGEMLGAEVDWNQDSKTVTVTSGRNSTPQGARDEYLEKEVQMQETIENYLDNLGKPDTKDPLYPYGYNNSVYYDLSEGTVCVRIKNITEQTLLPRTLYLYVVDTATKGRLESIPLTIKSLVKNEEDKIIIHDPTQKYTETYNTMLIVSPVE